MDWSRFWKDVGLEKLGDKLKQLRSTRSVWLAVQRNPDVTKPSMLYGIRCNSLNPNQSQEGSNILFCYKFIQRDFVDKFKDTKMYWEPVTNVDYEGIWNRFQQWSSTGLLTTEEVNSWKPIRDGMKHVFSRACHECSMWKMKQKLHSIKKIHNLLQPDARGKQQKILKKINLQYEKHREQCQNDSETHNFHETWNKIYWNAISCHHDMFHNIMSNTCTDSFIDECETHCKWKTPAIKRIFYNPFKKTRCENLSHEFSEVADGIPNVSSIHDFDDYVEMPVCHFQVCRVNHGNLKNVLFLVLGQH